MFCPQCKAEYRQGFTRCADCDIDLVYELQHEPHKDAAAQGTWELDGREAGLRPIWKGNDNAGCLALCRDLMKADIPYKVAQVSGSRSPSMQVDWRYEIGVSASDYERAKQLLGIEGEFEDACPRAAEEDDGDEADDADSLPPDDSPPDEEVRNDAYLEQWFPEDATAEVWCQTNENFSGAIEMALKENLIHCRSDLQDGVPRVFVLPEDEARAREIVRQVTENVPPK